MITGMRGGVGGRQRGNWGVMVQEIAVGMVVVIVEDTKVVEGDIRVVVEGEQEEEVVERTGQSRESCCCCAVLVEHETFGAID